MSQSFKLIYRIKWIIIGWMAASVAGGMIVRASAQSSEPPWTTPTNLSQSGGTSQPLIAAEPDGTLHAIWWDTTEGEQYAHTTTVTGTTWTQPIGVPAIVGRREVDPQTQRESISPPRGVSLLATARGNVHAFWFDTDDQLMYAQGQANSWTAAAVLSSSGSAFDAVADLTGTLHLAYIKPTPSAGAPSGIYYRAMVGAAWNDAIAVHESSYFRSAKPQDLHISVASVGQDDVLIVWDDLQLGESVLARSTNRGATWSAPQAVADPQSGRAQGARLAATPQGDVLLIWQDPSLGGCGFLQRRSADGGETWSAPERVLSAITRCAERWTFAPASDGRLWLIGRMEPQSPSDTIGAITLAAWDGRAWSQINDAALSFTDVTTNRAIKLDCLSISIAGNSAGLLGCDSIGDVWAVRNALDLNHLSEAPKRTWSDMAVISDRTASVADDGILAAAADHQGGVFAVWSQPNPDNPAASALYGSQWGANGWTRSVMILNTPGASDSNVVHAEQPAMTIDERDRIHVVWNSGANGPIYYAWSYRRDFTSPVGWSKPVELPDIAPTASRPGIATDLTGDAVYVIYAAPFNEHRGIYFTRSIDTGTTWAAPTLVFDAVAARWDSADKPRLTFDPIANVLHAVWLRSNVPGGFGLQAVYYARSNDNGQTWSEPRQLVEGAVDWLRLALSDGGQIYVAWTQAASQEQSVSAVPLSVWGMLSTDGGNQWTPPEKIAGFDRVSGPFGLEADRGGKLYLSAVGQTTSGESALLYEEWDAGAWSKFDRQSFNQTAQSGNSAAIAIAPSINRLGVLMRLWTYDTNGRGQFQVAAIDRTISVKAATPILTLTPQPTATPRPTETPAPTPTPRLQLDTNTKQPTTEVRGPNPLVLGGALAAIIVVAVAMRTIYIRRRWHKN